MEWWSRKALKFAFKEALALGFIVSCGLAKLFPIFDDGQYNHDAVLYMLFFALLYLIWDLAR